MSSDTDFTPVMLSTGEQLVVSLPSRWAGAWYAWVSKRFDYVIMLQIVKDGAVLDQASVPYPSAGIGGGRLLVSPSERFVVLSMFSGQSEERYDLFKLSGGLRHVGGLNYQLGEVASYAFSPDEALLAMALPFTCSEWWLPWEDGEVELGETGCLSFAFGQLRLHNIETGTTSLHELRVTAPEAWRPSGEDYDPDLRPRFLPNQRIALSMPWGDVELALTPPDIATLRIGATGSQ